MREPRRRWTSFCHLLNEWCKTHNRHIVLKGTWGFSRLPGVLGKCPILRDYVFILIKAEKGRSE